MTAYPDGIAQLHINRNRTTQNDWDAFASHRQHVTRILVDASSHVKNGDSRERRSPSLLVLGAGNGNDLDLATLATRFDRITLVDLDSDALDRCLARQDDRTRDQVTTLAPVDVAGLASVAGSSVPAPAELPQADIVVSTCLLSQLIDSALMTFDRDEFDRDDPRAIEFALAIRDQHLALLHRQTALGGRLVLVSDIVSSDTLPGLTNPELDNAASGSLPALVTAAVNDRNFFTGLNPAVLMRNLSLLSPQHPPLIHSPWRWFMGPRVYATIAITQSK